MKISVRLAAITAAALAAVGAGAFAPAASATQASVPLYDIVYYSDASKMVEVGRNYGVCYGGHGTPVWAGSSQYTSGQQTSYYSQEHVGWCTANGETIYH